MKELPFFKTSGAGNDFLIIPLADGKLESFTQIAAQELARRLCDRFFGVGADGLVLLTNVRDGVVRWEFFNSDGSRAAMCGNALRCVGAWAWHDRHEEQIKIQTERGTLQISRQGEDLFAAQMPEVSSQMKLLSQSGAERAWLLDTGVPHVVVEVDDLTIARREFDRFISYRHHSAAGAEGANVTFVQTKGFEPYDLGTVTFERGVEGFTLACGTGIVAAAVLAHVQSSGGARQNVIRLRAPGGEFRVQLSPADKPHMLLAELIGPANVICYGSIAKERLL